jgi:uncharacterized protein
MILRLSPALSLPADAATQKIAFIGRTGSGKTYAAGVMVEQMLHAKTQVVILDPVGVWYGLRLPAKPESSGFKIPVFGGLHGDVPLEATAGALVAELVVEKNLSIVLDVSRFESDADKARFARAFADRFFFLKKASPSPVHVVIEECQEFIPQNPRSEEAHMLHAFTRMWKLGRNFGIGGSLITQRPQEVSKKVLNQTELLFAFQMTGTHERKAIKEWAGDKGVAMDLVDELPGLKVGYAYAWSPQWLEFSAVVAFWQKETANVSSTPESGGKAKHREAVPVDLKDIAEQIKGTNERAKENDPAELKAKIRRLEADLAKKPVPTAERIEVPVFDRKDIVLLEGLISRLNAVATNCELTIGEVRRAKDAIDGLNRNIVGLTKPAAPNAPIGRTLTDMRFERLTPKNIVALAKSEEKLAAQIAGPLTGPQQKILAVVWMLGERGLTPNREMVARWLDLHPNGGTYNTNLGFLRKEGYLDGFNFTEKAADTFTVMRTGFDAALEPLNGSERNIMHALVNGGGRTFDRETLAAALDLHPNGGTYNTSLGRLRCMGLIPERGPIKLTEAALR